MGMRKRNVFLKLVTKLTNTPSHLKIFHIHPLEEYQEDFVAIFLIMYLLQKNLPIMNRLVDRLD